MVKNKPKNEISLFDRFIANLNVLVAVRHNFLVFSSFLCRENPSHMRAGCLLVIYFFRFTLKSNTIQYNICCDVLSFWLFSICHFLETNQSKAIVCCFWHAIIARNRLLFAFAFIVYRLSSNDNQTQQKILKII